MLANLLHNPQVRHLVALGEDLGQPTVGEVHAFLAARARGPRRCSARPFARVVGTQRLLPLDPAFDADRLRRTADVHPRRPLHRTTPVRACCRCCTDLPRHADDPAVARVEVAPLPVGTPSARPSEVAGHAVVRRGPLDAWEELVVRALRFGRDVQLAKGPRRELLDVKAVVTHPEPEDADVLAAYGFDLEAFVQYQREVLDPELPDGLVLHLRKPAARALGHRPAGRRRRAARARTRRPGART